MTSLFLLVVRAMQSFKHYSIMFRQIMLNLASACCIKESWSRRTEAIHFTGKRQGPKEKWHLMI